LLARLAVGRRSGVPIKRGAWRRPRSSRSRRVTLPAVIVTRRGDELIDAYGIFMDLAPVDV
jgi:hypothetical protein